MGQDPKCSSVQDCGRCTGLAWTEDIDAVHGRSPNLQEWRASPASNHGSALTSKTGRGVFVLFNSGALDGTPVGEDLLGIVP